MRPSGSRVLPRFNSLLRTLLAALTAWPLYTTTSISRKTFFYKGHDRHFKSNLLVRLHEGKIFSKEGVRNVRLIYGY